MGHIDRTAQSETLNQSRYVIRVGELAHNSYELDLTPERAGWERSSLCVVALAPGKPLTMPAGEHEYLVLSLPGGCTVQVSSERLEAAGRESVFTDITDYVYVPRRIEVTPTNANGARIIPPDSKATTDKPLRYYPRSGVGTGLWGVSPPSHQINNYALDNDVKTPRLLTYEVLILEGNWSSYPPHKHDEHTEVERVLEEVYYYQIRAGEGDAEDFVFQRIYSSPGHDTNVCTEVRGGDVIAMPYGHHGSSVVAPGHNLYYLSATVGPTEDSVWLMIDDSHHAWVRQTWKGQGINPRLPMTPMGDQSIRPSTAPPPEKSREEPRWAAKPTQVRPA